MLVEIKNLVKKYDGMKALDGIDLNIEEGHVIGLFGPNGSGKTTLMKVLADLLMQHEGDIKIDGKEIGIETKKIVSYLPDVNYLDDAWTIKESVRVFETFYEDFDKDKAEYLLREFNFTPKQRIKSLSKGNKEKVQLILALSRRAKLFLFDEPIAGVDPASREIVFDLILKNAPKDAAIIISTHLVLDIENIVDHVLFINRGKIILDESKKQLEEEYPDKTINEIFIDKFKMTILGGDN